MHLSSSHCDQIDETLCQMKYLFMLHDDEQDKMSIWDRVEPS